MTAPEDFDVCQTGSRKILDENALRIAELEAALNRSIVALDDWLNTYAAEFCNAGRVAEARKRISEKGTLGYIADIQKSNRDALYSRKGLIGKL